MELLIELVEEKKINEQIRKNERENIKIKCSIGLFHGSFVSSTMQNNMSCTNGYPFSWITGQDLLMLGDIHLRQIGKYGNMIWGYAGSLIQQNFGETIRKHGYGIYNISTNEYKFVDIENPKPFLSFKIDSIEDLENGTERLLNY